MEYIKFKKHTFYRLKSKLLERKYEYLVKSDKDIFVLLETYVKNLKIINLLYSRADIESLKYGNTNYPDTLYRNRQIYNYKFYALILGLIDGYLKEFNNKIDLLKDFRKIVVDNFISTLSINDIKIISKTINNTPCYTNFSNDLNIIFNEREKGLYLEFISTYMIGFSNYFSVSLIEIPSRYTKLYDDLCAYKLKNENKVYKLRKNC